MNLAPDPTAFRSELAAKACDRFIERMGDHFEAEGMPRISGRLFGLMLVEVGPISFSELAERLGVSRASISTNSRLLERDGLIERVRHDGERRDFFRLSDQPFVNMIRGVAARMRETSELVEQTCADFPDHGDGCGRIAATRHFFTEMISTLEALAVRLAAEAPIVRASHGDVQR
ncbi:DNA-binding transcriptional regulator GbsR, MarR family [Fulvimarina manganoxydans]|uniref:DNA-binding transcriptional regulator GbsR, MarR family n=1 Tax=Fulvimarina manganoxydans TaxID=937218 RepID=A0A1W1YKM4_9HYPH|nr:MarR family transcriptional regulator [Fulvimarina manganoxydans]SMC36278.1 DNA-binding transcriptional regulator GbsR, MarR family [Fulvimarina manganoxydans]